jgi:hypothetical protein
MLPRGRELGISLPVCGQRRTDIDVQCMHRLKSARADRSATLVPGGYFPDDLDTTSLALMVQPPSEPEMINSVLNRMSQNVQRDGSILVSHPSVGQLFVTLTCGQIYFDEAKPRTDEAVSCNILACFYRYNRGRELATTLQHICSVLSKRSYLQGTRYYPSADCVLWAFGRLLESAPHDMELQTKLRPLLKECVRERVGQSGDALELAVRINLCGAMGLDCKDDLQTLLRLQRPNGGWAPGWMYRYGSTGVMIGNKGLTTALALKAIKSVGRRESGTDLEQEKRVVSPVQKGFAKAEAVGCFGRFSFSRIVRKIKSKLLR